MIIEEVVKHTEEDKRIESYFKKHSSKILKAVKKKYNRDFSIFYYNTHCKFSVYNNLNKLNIINIKENFIKLNFDLIHNNNYIDFKINEFQFLKENYLKIVTILNRVYDVKNIHYETDITSRFYFDSLLYKIIPLKIYEFNQSIYISGSYSKINLKKFKNFDKIKFSKVYSIDKKKYLKWLNDLNISLFEDEDLYINFDDNINTINSKFDLLDMIYL